MNIEQFHGNPNFNFRPYHPVLILSVVRSIRVCVQAERQSQQQWEKELQERERRLKQQEEAFERLTGLEEMIQTRIRAVEEVRLHIQCKRCVVYFLILTASTPTTYLLSAIVLSYKLSVDTQNAFPYHLIAV